MIKTKKNKVLAIIILVVCLLFSVATLALYSVGDMIFDIALKSMAAPGITDEEIDNIGSENSKVPETDDTATSKDPSGNTQTKPGEAVIPPQTDVPKDNTNSNQQNPPVVTDPPATNNSNTQIPPAENKVSLSESQIVEIKSSVTAKDKISISALVLSKLSMDDISYLTGLLNGGLTSSEKAEAKKIAFAKFDDEELEIIYDYYNKYTK